MLAVSQPGKVGQLATPVVPARVVSEQVTDGVQVEQRGQPLRRLVADDEAQRVSEDGHGARIGRTAVSGPRDRLLRLSTHFPGAIPWLPSAMCAAKGRVSATTCRTRTAGPRAAGTRTFSACARWSARPRAG